MDLTREPFLHSLEYLAGENRMGKEGKGGRYTYCSLEQVSYFFDTSVKIILRPLTSVRQFIFFTMSFPLTRCIWCSCFWTPTQSFLYIYFAIFSSLIVFQKRIQLATNYDIYWQIILSFPFYRNKNSRENKCVSVCVYIHLLFPPERLSLSATSPSHFAPLHSFSLMFGVPLPSFCQA